MAGWLFPNTANGDRDVIALATSYSGARAVRKSKSRFLKFVTHVLSG
jgi:hypothetical protein